MIAETWLVCSLGGGWGHLVRGLSLAKVAARNGCTVHLLVDSQYSGRVGSIPGIYIHKVCSIEHNIAEALKIPHDRLIIDTFPVGLWGCLFHVLSQVTTPKTFIHRGINLAKIWHYEQQIAEWFNLILVPGEVANTPFANLPQAHTTSPWMICSADEIQRPSIARSRFNLDPDTPSIFVLASGNQSEQSYWASVCLSIAQRFDRYQFRYIASHPLPGCGALGWARMFPAMPWLMAADVVVGAGGYNTVNECRALDVPLAAIPLDRVFDLQADRLAAHQSERLVMARTINSMCEAIEPLLAQPPAQFPPTYVNGAEQAFALISGCDR
jgi:hypothetical protein